MPLLLIEAAKRLVILSVPRMDGLNVLIYCVAKPLQREEGFSKSAEKDLVSLDSSRDFVERLEIRRIGRFGASDIPLLLMSFYVFRLTEFCNPAGV